MKFNSESFISKLRQHPDYPSLLSIQECLSEWGISAEAYQISLDDFDSEDLSYPFIADLSDDEERLVLVHHTKDDVVHLSDERHKRFI